MLDGGDIVLLKRRPYDSIWIATLAACFVPAGHAAATVTASPSGFTVYDSVNGVNWLADTNLAATNRFSLPLCTGSGNQVCVNASGSMNYQSAAAWVNAMNAANYLGHSNWQLTNHADRRQQLRQGGAARQLVRIRLHGQRAGLAVL